MFGSVPVFSREQQPVDILFTRGQTELLQSQKTSSSDLLSEIRVLKIDKFLLKVFFKARTATGVLSVFKAVAYINAKVN